MKYKLVIFDLDGTLLDTLDDLSAAVNYAMQRQGFPLHSRDEYMKMVGHGAKNLMRQALPADHKDDEAMVDAVYNEFRAYYSAHIDVHTQPFPGITNLLTQLHQNGVLLAVASNKFQEGTEHLIKEFFPEVSFVTVLGNRPNFPLKPEPEIVGEILKKADAKKEEAVMVGDSDTDMETAANGGIASIPVGWGYRNMRGIEGLTVAETAEELLQLLMP